MTPPAGAGSSCRGRFAPSPTGPLHFGSLVAAVASYLDARSRGGAWLVRIEDLDAPRCVPGAADEILGSLEAHGLLWDGEVAHQSRRQELYREALDRLRDAGRLFGCRCTRKEIADSANGPDGARRYPGTCRAGLPAGAKPRAWRVRVPPGPVCFDDRLQGRVCQDLEAQVGDFVVMRADGLFAYQLAVVVDDAAQGITDVVRGADLLDSTPRQILLQRLLGLPTPAYLHVPVAVDPLGQKLSKQTGAAPLAAGREACSLVAAFGFLGLDAPKALARALPAECLAWGIAHWPERRLPRTLVREAPARIAA